MHFAEVRQRELLSGESVNGQIDWIPLWKQMRRDWIHCHVEVEVTSSLHLQ